MTRLSNGKAAGNKFSRKHSGYQPVKMADDESSETANGKSENNWSQEATGEAIPNYEETNPFNSMLKTSSPLLPFIVLIVLKLLFDARIEIFLCIALFITCYKTNSLFLEVTGLRKDFQRLVRAAQLAGFMILNIFFILIVYSDSLILRIFIFMKPKIELNVYEVVFYVALVDFLIKMMTMVIKCVIYLIPSRVFPNAFEDKGWVYLSIELVSQLYRTVVPFGLWIHMLIQMDKVSEYVFNIFLIIMAIVFKLFQLKSIGDKVIEQFKSFGKETYHAMPVEPSTKICPLCQCNFSNPVITGPCMHIFCSKCLAAWCNRDKKCPICKEDLVNVESIDYRDGYTGQYLQLF